MANTIQKIAAIAVCLCTAFTPDRAYAREACTQLDQLVRIVDMTDKIIVKQSKVALYEYDSLWAMSERASTDHMRRQLIDATHGSQADRVAQYLATIEDFLHIRRVNGPEFGHYKLNAREFRDLHAHMTDFTKQICAQNSVGGKLKESFDALKASLGYTGPDTGKKAPPSRLNGDVRLRGSDYALDHEAQRLSYVFFLLFLTIVSVFLSKEILNYVHAIRLSRHECTVPAFAEVAGIPISGTINVISKQGLSFQLLQTAPEHHAALFAPGVQFRFHTEKCDFKGVLTKNFDDGSGFRLVVPLNSYQIKDILGVSKTQPLRKTKFKAKKKVREKQPKPQTPSIALSPDRKTP